MTLETFFEKFELFADAPNAVAKMRELILQIAVQGRLVDPSVNDEPVEKYLRRIWADTSDNRSELTDAEKTQPFELPAHWRWVVLAEVAEFSIGKTPSRGDSSYWYPEDHSWVSIADMKHYGTITETKEKVSALAAGEVFRQRFAAPGSILMSFKLTIGKVARAGIRCFHNEAIISLLPPEPELAEYLFRFLPIFAALQTSNNAIKGSTLNKGLLTLLPIALPPLAEQKRIVAKVDELMALCDRLEGQQRERETRQVVLARAALARFADAPTPANLDFIFHPSYAISPADLRKAILTLAVQGKLVPQDANDEPATEIIKMAKTLAMRNSRLVRVLKAVADRGQSEEGLLPVLPDGWAWTCNAELGDTSPRNDATDESLVAFAPMNRVPTDYRASLDFESRRWGEVKKGFTHFANGDIAVAKITPCFQNGKACVMANLTGGIGAGTTELHVLRPHPNTVFPLYMLLFLKSPEFVTGGVATFTGTAGQQRVSNDYFRFRPIPLPPLAEQRRIVAKVEQLMALVDALEVQIATARATAANLLDALVAELTGTPHSGKGSVPAATATGRRGRPPKA